MDPRVRDELLLVVEHGRPAEVALALELLQRLESSPEPGLAAAAFHLLDAHLHDPHLTR